MHRSPLAQLVLLALAAVSFPACQSTCLEPTDRHPWILTRVEIDCNQLHNTGSLPVYRKTDGYTFGQEPVAIGIMQASQEGLWTISVRFRETIVSFGGRTGTHEYEVVQLAGKADKSGQRICAQGAIPTDVKTGIATEVRVTKISTTKLKVQPYTRDKKLPYVFTFDCTPAQARPVSIPLL
jgi:hypothetical protein